MKKIILTLGFMAGVVICLAQTTPPADVLQQFAVMYPDTHVRTWTQEGVDLWMVTFKDKDDKTKDMAYFKKNGDWVKTETKIPIVADLPNSVAMGWRRTDFNDWLVDNMKEVKYPNRDLYVITVEQGCGGYAYSMPNDCSEAYNLYFTRSGTLLKQIPSKTDDFDDVSGDDFR